MQAAIVARWARFMHGSLPWGSRRGSQHGKRHPRCRWSASRSGWQTPWGQRCTSGILPNRRSGQGSWATGSGPGTVWESLRMLPSSTGERNPLPLTVGNRWEPLGTLENRWKATQMAIAQTNTHRSIHYAQYTVVCTCLDPRELGRGKILQLAGSPREQ